MNKVKVGIMGTGKISDIYIRNIMGMHSDVLDLTAISSRHYDRAVKCAEKYGIPNALPVEEFYSSNLFDVMLNITVPKAHYEVSKKGLEAGKHVYSEKPLSMTYSEGMELVELARSKGLYLGGAPDTFMGAGGQAARKAIDDGLIGKPVSFLAFMLCHGWEKSHPNPDFYYAKGGGPMFDMGPYYLTALVNLLGPISSVSAMGANLISDRKVLIGPREGEQIPVETLTHVAGNAKFTCGAVGSIVTSFDVWPIELPNIIIFGTEGTLFVPDPNLFSGELKFVDGKSGKTEVLPLPERYRENSRGAGLRDMAIAIQEKRPCRASSELTSHVLEAMEAFHLSGETGKEVILKSICERPQPLV